MSITQLIGLEPYQIVAQIQIAMDQGIDQIQLGQTTIKLPKIREISKNPWEGN